MKISTIISLFLLLSLKIVAQSNDEKADYAVYSKVIKEYIQRKIVSSDVKLDRERLVFRKKKTIMSYELDTSKISDPSFLRFLSQDFLEIEGNHLKSIDTLSIRLMLKLDSSANNGSFKVQLLDIPYKTHVIVERKITRMFKHDIERGWKRFYKKYPKSLGILDISDIVYSENKHFCLVYIGVHHGTLNGGGGLFLLDLQSKDNHLIKKYFHVWSS